MDDWISVKVRYPTEADADPLNCVMVWHEFQGVMVTGWRNVRENRFMTHWMTPPMRPADRMEKE